MKKNFSFNLYIIIISISLVLAACCVAIVIFFSMNLKNESGSNNDINNVSINEEISNKVKRDITGNYIPGTVQNMTYKNDWLKIKYTLNNNMDFYDKVKLKALTDHLNNRKDKINEEDGSKYSEFNADFMANEGDGKIEIFVVKLDEKNTQEIFLATRAARTYNFDKMISTPYKIGEVEFTKIANLKSKDGSSWATCLIKKTGDYYIRISVTANSIEKVEKLLSGFSKL